MDTKAVIRALVKQVEEEAARHAGRRVVSLRARVGELSGVDPAALAREFADAVHGTPLEGATLTVETVESEAVCEQCGHKFPFDQSHMQCSRCGSMRLALHGGDALFLDSALMEE
jgi:hydrogenase nickel insertion protein HypA